MSVITGIPSGLLFKRLLLGLWVMYFTMVAITNFVDLMEEFGAFDWTFLNSDNFSYLESVVKVYDVGEVPTKLLLAGAFVIEVAAAALFWRAIFGYGRKPGGAQAAFQAVCLGTLVWISFVFMTEFFVAYDAESPFRELLALMIGTGIAVALVPDNTGASARAKS
ncbi:MAG: hypothetical protein ACRDKH_05285 [Solirubrobacterales bacterium]